MIVLSIISCMALLFSRYYPKKNVSIGLKWAFILLALVSGIRYNYGNDYIRGEKRCVSKFGRSENI